jgi:sulfur dioxygenase
MEKEPIFFQLFEKETSTYTYLLGDPETKEAVIIDPVIETVNRDVKLLEDLELKLKYIIETHVHADHITGAGELRKRTGAKIALSSSYDMSCPDLRLKDQDEIRFGSHTIKVFHTPGHTNGCLSYQLGHMVFTGDALLIRGCGRTDFQEGSSEKLYESIKNKIFTLPDETIVYPGHDYNGFTKSTIGLEKRLNPRLKDGITMEQFTQIMASLNLPYPKKIQEAVPANLLCGHYFKEDQL